MLVRSEEQRRLAAEKWLAEEERILLKRERSERYAIVVGWALLVVAMCIALVAFSC